MNVLVTVVLLTACVFGEVEYSQAARILAVVSTPSYSHEIPFRPLWRSLISRGHELVLATTYPMPNINSTRLTQINIGHSNDLLKKVDFIELKHHKTWLDILRDDPNARVSYSFSLSVFENPELQKLYAADSNITFDVVMAECVYTHAVFALAHRFNAPLIGLTTVPPMSHMQYIMGWFILPSHPSSWDMELRVGFSLPFWQRVKNFVLLWHAIYVLIQYHFPQQQQLAERFLGNDVPSVIDIGKNMSLLFLSQSDVLSFPRPKMPNVIVFDSFRDSKESAPLPKELKRFVENATNGFIYFSLGGNAKSSDLPQESRRIFCDIFAKLSYKVVWKYEKELPEKTEDIFTAPWLPQKSILAHPNIKLFIFQGGLQSLEEAVRYTVPLVAIPVLADQEHNANKLVSIGVARRLDITRLTKTDVEDAIVDVLTDKGYKERMVQLKNLTEDKPYDQIKNLVWWTEFVIRHKGAPHLRSSIVDEPWYQRYDLDVVAFLGIVIFCVSICLLILIYKFLVIALSRCGSPSMNHKQKTS